MERLPVKAERASSTAGTALMRRLDGPARRGRCVAGGACLARADWRGVPAACGARKPPRSEGNRAAFALRQRLQDGPFPLQRPLGGSFDELPDLLPVCGRQLEGIVQLPAFAIPLYRCIFQRISIDEQIEAMPVRRRPRQLVPDLRLDLRDGLIFFARCPLYGLTRPQLGSRWRQMKQPRQVPCGIEQLQLRHLGQGW